MGNWFVNEELRRIRKEQQKRSRRVDVVVKLISFAVAIYFVLFIGQSIGILSLIKNIPVVSELCSYVVDCDRLFSEEVDEGVELQIDEPVEL